MAYREFTDRQGRTWRAWDTYPQSRSIVTAPYAEGWLCFESQAGKRRLTPIPEGWDELPQERLCMLLRAADQVVPLRVESDLRAEDPTPLP
ncbi:MAG TPA: hypothetical protein VFQ76_18655 [Longimicrobiaceae bacterium]|nr:hypothetical protein [Longimicrobiaceae bacterium]